MDAQNNQPQNDNPPPYDDSSVASDNDCQANVITSKITIINCKLINCNIYTTPISE